MLDPGREHRARIVARRLEAALARAGDAEAMQAAGVVQGLSADAARALVQQTLLGAATMRGMHYQLAPAAESKLVRCTRGAVFDVAVDVRRSSPTFGKHVAVHLSAENKEMLWVPPGFAHGYLVLSEHAILLYKTTDYYAPEHERTLLWNDPALATDIIANPAGYYMNWHSTLNAGGILRGQLVKG